MEPNTYKVDFNREDLPAGVKALQPKVFEKDGQWLALYEEAHNSAITGSGDTPEAALEDFENKYEESKQDSY